VSGTDLTGVPDGFRNSHGVTADNGEAGGLCFQYYGPVRVEKAHVDECVGAGELAFDGLDEPEDGHAVGVFVVTEILAERIQILSAAGDSVLECRILFEQRLEGAQHSQDAIVLSLHSAGS